MSLIECLAASQRDILFLLKLPTIAAASVLKLQRVRLEVDPEYFELAGQPFLSSFSLNVNVRAAAELILLA